MRALLLDSPAIYLTHPLTHASDFYALTGILGEVLLYVSFCVCPGTAAIYLYLADFHPLTGILGEVLLYISLYMCPGTAAMYLYLADFHPLKGILGERVAICIVYLYIIYKSIYYIYRHTACSASSLSS